MVSSSRTNSTKIQKRVAFRRNLHILRSLINSNLEKTSSIIMDAYFYIQALTLKLEALKRARMEYNDQLALLEVKVKKLEENRFRLSVTSQKGEDNLVHILEVFEEMDLNVIHASVSCNNHFTMDATVELSLDVQHAIDQNVLSESVYKAIERSVSN